MATELSWQAQEVVYQIRHVIRRELLDDELALRHARALLFEPVTGVSLSEEYDALVEALGSDVRLSTWHGDPRFERVLDENEFRAYLCRIVERLDAMRPWPVPLYRALAPDMWRCYDDSRVVGKLRLRTTKVEKRIHRHLLPMARLAGEGQVDVAVLELRSGHEIALVGRWWRDDPDATAVLTRDPDVSAAELMAELTSGDHFEPHEYEVLG